MKTILIKVITNGNFHSVDWFIVSYESMIMNLQSQISVIILMFYIGPLHYIKKSLKNSLFQPE